MFLDRDGSVFGHVLVYLRDGVVAAGCEHDVSMLERVKREFGFCCIEVVAGELQMVPHSQTCVSTAV